VGHDQGKNVRLTVSSDGQRAEFRAPTYFTGTFTRQADGTWKAPTGLGAELITEDDGSLSVRHRRSALKLRFAAGGSYLDSYEDRNGNEVDPVRSTGSQTTRIADSQGRDLTLRYDSAFKQLKTITDWAGRTWSYAYDASNELVSHTDPEGGVTRYAYHPDGSHRPTEVTTPAGRITRIAYDGGSGRVAAIERVTSDSGNQNPRTLFAYATADSRCADPEPPGARLTSTRVTDANGNATVYCHDAEGRVKKTIDARLVTQGTLYTSDSNVRVLRDGAARDTTGSYDALERLTQVDHPKCCNIEAAQTRVSYPEETPGAELGPRRWLPVKVTEKLGHSLHYGYDAKGNLTTVSDDLATTSGAFLVELAYNADGTVRERPGRQPQRDDVLLRRRRQPDQGRPARGLGPGDDAALARRAQPRRPVTDAKA
jgi:YD repeat-containing protein